jgi:hypothetical protein
MEEEVPSMNPEIYKVKSINADGESVETYVMPEFRRFFVKSMMEEYGNVEEEGMMLSDLPEGVIQNLKKL